MWGCGRSPQPHIYPSPLLEGSFFSALMHRINLIDIAPEAQHKLTVQTARMKIHVKTIIMIPDKDGNHYHRFN